MRDCPNASLNYSLRARTSYFRTRLIHFFTNQHTRLIELRFGNLRLAAIVPPLLHDHGESLDAVPLLAIKFEKVRSDAPAFLLPARPGQLLVGLDGAGAVGWRNPDGSIVAPGPDDAGGAPGPLLARNSIVRPDGVVVRAPAGTRGGADAEGDPLPVSAGRAEDRPETTSEIEITSELTPQPFGEVRPA